MSTIPKDPVILLSFLNTKLRDHYDSLSALCDDLEQDETALTQKIAAIGYTYDSDHTKNRCHRIYLRQRPEQVHLTIIPRRIICSL